MRFKVNFKAIQLDLQGAVNEMHQYLTERTKKSGQHWLAAATEPIPTWSGASRSTFQQLARAVGTSVPIGPQLSRKNRVPLGLATGRGGLVVSKVDGKYYFFYETDLRYLAYNEYNKAVKGMPPQPFSNNVRHTPYGFQRRGEKAWKAFVEKTMLPNPYKHIRGVPI